MKKPITIYVSNKEMISRWDRAEMVEAAKQIAAGVKKIREQKKI